MAYFIYKERIIFMKKFVVILLLAFLLVSNINSLTFDKRNFLMGIVATPKNYPNFTIDDLEEAYNITSDVCELVNLWLSVPWWEEEEKLNSSSTKALIDMIYEEELTPVFHTNFWSLKYVEGYGIAPTLDLPPDMPKNTTMGSNEFRQRWIEHVKNISKNYKPAFYSIGNEVDLFYNYEPNRPDFDNYVSLVAESYNAIKSVSPHTQVMVVFKIENLIDKNTWFLIDKFDKNKIDLIAFTTYPYLMGYTSPYDIPLNYYDEIIKHTGEKKVAFTEIGWSSSSIIEGSEEKQAEFLSWFLSATEDIPVNMICWLFLHDLAEEGKEKNANELVGLRKNNGEPKEAWQHWKNLHDIKYKNNPPSPPIKPSGSIEGKINVKYIYSTFSTDIDNDCLFYLFDWGDGSKEWLGPFKQGEVINATHEWEKVGNYIIKVKARDLYEESEWSENLIVSMPFYFLNIIKIGNYLEIFGKNIFIFGTTLDTSLQAKARMAS